MSLHSSTSDLLCRNGCGFYGNPEWQWFCSKCWREHQRKHGSPARTLRSPTSPMSPVQTAQPPVRESPQARVSPSKKVSKTVAEKRHTIDKNIKQLFGARMNQKESPEKSPKLRPITRNQRPELPKEAKEVSSEFAAYLNQRLERPAVADVSKHVKGMVDKIFHYNIADTEHVDDLSAMVQEFYQLFQKRLEHKQLYQALSDDEREIIMDYTEKYITVCTYKYLFCPPMTSDEEKDLELQNRIRSLNWISTEHLGCSIDEFSQEVRDLLYEAINDMLQIDGKIAPQDKMACLVKCSKAIFDMLKISNESPASADDFLPCLIYICLKANPPRIQSNINFITRFCNENKLRMGEGGYFFANLCCAMSFIENMKAESINMDPNEFEAYVCGKSAPLESWRSNLLMCEGLQIMSQNLKTLGDLKSKQENILSQAKILQDEMEKFEKEVSQDIDAVLERTTYEIKKRTKEPANIDEELPDESSLPAPLLPALPDKPPESGGINLPKTPNLGIEDYLSSSDCTSLLSLDLSGTNPDPGEASNLEASLTSYRGFSAQSSAIPSISCDNALASPVSHSSSSFTVSSSTCSSATATLKKDRDRGLTTSSSSDVVSPSSTSSSSPVISSTEPDPEDQNPGNAGGAEGGGVGEVPRRESAGQGDRRRDQDQDRDDEPTAVKVLSGIFETFDNLL